MKVPFSYRQQLFSPILLASFVGHGLLFIGGMGWISSPEYAVEHAPSSVEVVLLQETPFNEPEPQVDRVLTAKDDQPENHAVLEKKEELVHEQQRVTPIVSPPMKGAVQEAKPNYLRNPAPRYPQLAKQRGWEGVVILKVLVEKDGSVGEISVERSSGYDVLDGSALRTVRTWRFSPARMGRLALSSWVRIPVRFRLISQE